MALVPQVVGDIAHGALVLDDWSADDVRALLRHNLAHAASIALTDAWRREVIAEPIVRVAREQSMRSIAVAATTASVTTLLRTAGVRALAYKGSALAVQTTGAWQGRGSSDVDLLVDVADLPLVDAALVGAGMTRRAGAAAPPGAWERWRIGERTYVGGPVAVDLHWRVETVPGYYDVAFDELWGRHVEVDIDGTPVATFEPVDALLVTAVHGAKERWWRWFWALDAVRQAEALPADAWDTARARAEASRCRAALDLALGVARACGARLPLGVVSSDRMAREADVLLADSASSGDVEWTLRGALHRRRARFAAADRPTAAIDGIVRSVARLVADRRMPTTPQVPKDPSPPTDRVGT